MRVGIANRRCANGHLAGCAVNNRIELVFATIQCQRSHERLHGRARFEAIGDGTISQLTARKLRAVIRVVRWPVRQRQNFAGFDIGHNHAATLGIEFLCRITQGIEGNELNLGINGQLDVFTILRWTLRTHFFNDLPTAILDHRTFAIGTDQTRFERQLDTFLTAIIFTGKAHHVRHHLARRVKTTVLAVHLDAG